MGRPSESEVRAMRASTGVALGLLLVAVGLGLHGFSLPLWHGVIDGSPAPELLAGTPRVIRGDDWYVHVPLLLAQRAHEPPFPRVNTDVGLGQDVILPIPVPILHPVTLFRPSLWGFFAGPDTGLSWMWWSRLVGVFLVWAWVLWLVAGARPLLALLGGGLVATAPIVQFWSLNGGPSLIFAGLLVVGFAAGVRARRPVGLLAAGALLAWGAVGFVLVFYPPYQVVLAYVVLALVAGHAVEHRDRLARHGLRRLVALGAAVVVAATLVAALLLDALPVLEAMMGTTYPGRRLSTGGNYPLWWILSGDLGAVTRLWSQEAGVPVGHAITWLLFPPLAAAVVVPWLREGRGDPLALAVVACTGLLVLFAAVGLPGLVARATLLSFVLDPRVGIGLCVADAVLLVRFLARPPPAGSPSPKAAWAIAGAWAGLLAVCAVPLHAREPALGVPATALAIGVQGAVALLVLRRRLPAVTLSVVVVVVAAHGLAFNPLVRGGSGYLRENALSRRMLAIDREAGGDSFWAVFGPAPLGNLPRALGVKALNGVHPVPQAELWRQLDPRGRHRHVTNRYAHVLMAATRRDRPAFRLVGPDGFVVAVAPDSSYLRCLGVTHALVRVEEENTARALRRREGLAWLGSVGPHRLFRVRGGRPEVCPPRSATPAQDPSSGRSDRGAGKKSG